MMRRLTISLAGVLALTLPATIQAVPIAVVNPSFESPAHPLPVPCGSDCSFNFGPVNGWTIDSGGFGIFHPGPPFFNLPLPDGHQTAYGNFGTLSQEPTATLENDTTYELRVEVGKRRDIEFPGYRVALFAGSTLIGFESSLAPAVGEFETSLVTYTSAVLDPLAGQALRIELFSAGSQTNFDDVRLDASRAGGAVVPEPGTVLLVGAGLAGLFGARKRRP
jgi:hypothetical protein